MALRPQCNRLAVSFNDESAYGMAIADAAINKRINPREPVFINPSLVRQGNESVIKGSEFATDPDNRSVLTSQDMEMPFTVDAGLSTLGWMLALVFGSIVTDDVTPGAGTGDDFRHSFFASDLCVDDQFPSTSLVLGFAGTNLSHLLVKGAILNELRIALSERGVLEVSGTIFTDGTATPKPLGFAFPLSDMNESAEFLTNLQADFFTADIGDPLVSQRTKLRGFELVINNNLDRDDARGQLTRGAATLEQLRTGDREITLNVSVEGHQGDQNWDDFIDGIGKDVRILVQKDVPNALGEGGRLLDIRTRSTLIDTLEDIGFDGIRSRFRLGYKLYALPASDYNAGRLPTSALPVNVLTPLLVEVRNGDATYFTVSA